MLLYWVWPCVIDNPPNLFCGQECRSRNGNCYQQQSHTSQLSNLMCYKWPTMMQQTTQVSDRKWVSFSLAAGHSMQTTPSACLTVEANSRKIFFESAWLAMQCKLLHLLCCRQLYILCLPNHPNISNCLPDSATLRSLLAVSTSPCITASTTASLSLTPARAPVEEQVTFHNEQKIIKQHSQLGYTTLYTLKTVNSYQMTAGAQG